MELKPYLLLEEILVSMGMSGELAVKLLPLWNKRIAFKKQDFIIREGQKEQYIYLMLSGTARIYVLNDTSETCVGFLYEGNLFSAFDSLASGLGTAYYIQPLSKCEALAISRRDFYDFLEKEPALERFWRILLERVLLSRMQREVEMLTLSPKQRYERLFERSPHVFQLIPLKYIASYLNISPETLSRLRGK
jgi:CRP-like cAMP-binding protein